MSRANRLRMYQQLLKEGRLSQDDGALEKEFGEKKEEPEKPPVEKVVEKPTPKKKKVTKKNG